MKIVCYGVRENEIPYFERLNQYHYDLKLVSEFLTEKNADLAEGMDAVLLRGNCLADERNLTLFARYGIKYVFTRTVGYNHIDLAAAEKLGLQVARVPNYSPFAVAELALTLGLQLFRNVSSAVAHSAQGDFRVLPTYFSKEIHTATVGVIGAGKIGLAEAKLYHGLGARVVAFDPRPAADAPSYIEFLPLEAVLAQSDIVTVHVPYFPGKNDKFIDAAFLKQMKSTAILVNTARGEIVDTAAITAALQANQLAGYAADVVIDEQEIMGHTFADLSQLPNPEVRELAQLAPRVLLTPHIGSYTESALVDMIKISFANFHQSMQTGTNDNILVQGAVPQTVPTVK